MKFRQNKKGKNKSKVQKNALYNVEMLYKARNEVIKFHDDYFLMVFEAKNRAKNKISVIGFNILTPKQLL